MHPPNPDHGECASPRPPACNPQRPPPLHTFFRVFVRRIARRSSRNKEKFLRSYDFSGGWKVEKQLFFVWGLNVKRRVWIYSYEFNHSRVLANRWLRDWVDVCKGRAAAAAMCHYRFPFCMNLTAKRRWRLYSVQCDAIRPASWLGIK